MQAERGVEVALKQLVNSAMVGAVAIGLAIGAVGVRNVFVAEGLAIEVTGWIMIGAGLGLAVMLAHAAWQRGNLVREALNGSAVKGASSV